MRYYETDGLEHFVKAMSSFVRRKWPIVTTTDVKTNITTSVSSSEKSHQTLFENDVVLRFDDGC